jgi:hypothetical protein
MTTTATSWTVTLEEAEDGSGDIAVATRPAGFARLARR